LCSLRSFAAKKQFPYLNKPFASIGVVERHRQIIKAGDLVGHNLSVN
jgi:hypothetical protein